MNRISKPLTVLVVHKTCCGKKVFAGGRGGEEKKTF